MVQKAAKKVREPVPAPSSAPSPAKQNDQSVQKEVKKLSKHIGLIEGEVNEITKRYEQLKKEKEAKE